MRAHAQAVAMLESGADLRDADLALAAASHSGEPMHVDRAFDLLERARLTEDDLARTLAEGWVDLDGFLVSDDPDAPGSLAGFCWTRVHPATDEDPELGEIFAIGVAPAHQRRASRKQARWGSSDAP